MPTLVVSHKLSLMGCLVAAALRLYFQARNLKIIVVETLDTAFSSQPYCGISAISNQRLVHSAFLQRAFFHGVLPQALTFLDLIQILNLTQTRPEFPNASQKIRASLGLPALYLAVVYHPQLLLSVLRQTLLLDPLVTFLSVQSGSSLSQIPGDCYINFALGEGNNKTGNLDLAAHSSLCPVELVPENRHQMPPVLWLPSFKASTQMFEAMFTSSTLHSFRQIEIYTINLNANENTFASRYDLNHGLRACDYVLLLMEPLAAPLGLVPVRL